MKINLYFFMLLMEFLIINSFAMNSSLVTLKDGTKIEGNIISKNDDKIKIETKMMGVVELSQKNIDNISEIISIVTLKDGTSIEGTILSKSNGKVKIETKMMGVIDLDEKNVANISDKDSNDSRASNSNRGTESKKVQGNKLQNEILKDPEMVKEIYTLIQQDDVKNTLTEDQKNNFLSNPKVVNLIDKIRQKLSK